MPAKQHNPDTAAGSGDMARLGVDIGGTFTDVVLETDIARFSVKKLTTYAAPEEAIISGIADICAQAAMPPHAITQLIHGTTLATNALIERRGAKTALITTRGFRDVIELRTESRFEQYDLNLELPEPLIARQHRYVLDERIAADGDVLRALDEDEVRALVPVLRKAAYQSIAVGLIHSYTNNEHEIRIRDILEDALPGVDISLSCEVSPQMREYERFNTVLANAYIKPMMRSYLERLRERLGGVGVSCPVFLMHSGGGIISLDSAAAFPVRLVESGPAGGAVFAAHMAARHGLEKVVSFDMGGTTAKICLIKDYTPKTHRVFEVARSYRFKKGSGMPISIPSIDMVEIGAGGGSIAHIDAMQQIRVGPHSAGSEPGPACYGRGGMYPAVTDADLLLGRLDPDNFAGGSIRLDPERAEAAIETEIAAHLALDLPVAAHGICEVVDETMANATRMHAVENGEDLEGYVMIAFGGAAPVHAARLCEKLGITRLLIPEGAGVGSAIGFLRAPFSYEATRSLFMKLSAFDRRAAAEILTALSAEAMEFVKECGVKGPITFSYRLYMRYHGQGSDIPVVLSADMAADPTAASIKSLFEEQYAILFGRVVAAMDIEITVWTATATTPKERVEKTPEADPIPHPTPEDRRLIFDPISAQPVSAGILARRDMPCDGLFYGPLAITEDETGIIVPARAAAMRRADGAVEITFQKN